MIKYYTSSDRLKKKLKTLLNVDAEKYSHLIPLNLVEFPDNCKTDEEKYNFMRLREPFDYMNLVRTYEMFLQHISICSSTSTKDSYIDEELDKGFYIK